MTAPKQFIRWATPVVVGVVFLALAVVTFDETNAQAQGAPSGSVTPNLRLAASGFGPVPANTILSRSTLSEIADELRRRKWSVPPEDSNWPMRDGDPVVNTRAVDEMRHTIEGGQSAYRIRHMYRVRRSQLEEWNPDVNLDDLEEGQELVVWKRTSERVSKSYGYPHRGRLFRGEPLPASDKYEILYPYRTFGTYYTISELRRVFGEYYGRFPDSHPLMVGDISFRTGRAMNPHKSHESGRDVDISYPRKNDPPNLDRFHYVRRDELHVKRTLALMKSFIDGGQVEYVFMDRWFQKMLREEALRQGATKEWVEAVFQYPHWSGGKAIIRHAGGHRNHFHIRFKCQETDYRCR
jgi:murein endopeptidase